MKSIKYIQILVLILFPSWLLGVKDQVAQPVPSILMLTDATDGAWTQYDKKKNPIILEWHKLNDYEASLNWFITLAHTIAEAFADESKDLRNFLLDDKLHVKKEYAEVMETLSEEDRNEIEWRGSISGKDRQERIKLFEQYWLGKFEKIKASLLMDQENAELENIDESAAQEEVEPVGDSGDRQEFFVVIAKDKGGNVLGLGMFRLRDQDIVSLDLLGIVPSAQGVGVSRLLVFSILKLMSQTKCIKVSTEIWNLHAQAVYKALGFVESKKKGLDVSFRYTVKN